MKVRKLSVSFEPELGDAVREAAERARQTLSGWLAEAAAARLRADALADFLASWEADHGAITEEELAAAAARLRLTITGAHPATDQEQGDSRARRVTPKAAPQKQRRSRPTRAAGAGR